MVFDLTCWIAAAESPSCARPRFGWRPAGKPPAEWVELLAARGIEISQRSLREKVNRLGACHKFGRAMKCAPIRIKGYTNEERVAQDRLRGKPSRVKKTPGSWEWLLKFREHAGQRHAALAYSCSPRARISQAIEMHPGNHLKLQEGLAGIPAAKGHEERWIKIPSELVAELANLPTLYPRGAERKPENLRLFGFADRSSPRKGWAKACKDAGIELIPFHAAGRHGFGQEMNVRQKVDEKAAGAFGGWSDTNLMRRTYTHAEDAAVKVHKAFRTGLRQAEKKTKINLTGKVA